MFEKSLQDLVRGIRSSSGGGRERDYIYKRMEEIQLELKTDDMDLKSNAIAKLGYLYMLSYDCPWAYFHVVEVMASTKIEQKRIGYMCAAQFFTNKPEVLALCSNLFRKDLRSKSQVEVTLVLGTFAQIMTVELAQELNADILVLLSHTNPSIRKKAIITLYHVFLKHPEALLLAFTRLKEMLEDSDSSIASVVVNVMYELARKNPKPYLPLSPALFRVLTTTTNNWLRIKVVKLLALLAPMEPRLVRKIVPPLQNILQTTSALSILYEVIQTFFAGEMLPSDDVTIANMCIERLQSFLSHSDQNSLISLDKLPLDHSYFISKLRPLLLPCTTDSDSSIRRRTVTLLVNYVTQESFQEVSDNLLKMISSKIPFKEKLWVAEKFVIMCSHNYYERITDFEALFDTWMALVKPLKTGSISFLISAVGDLLLRVPDLCLYVSEKLDQIFHSSVLRFESGCELFACIVLVISQTKNVDVTLLPWFDKLEGLILCDEILESLKPRLIHVCLRIYEATANEETANSLKERILKTMTEISIRSHDTAVQLHIFEVILQDGCLKKPGLARSELKPVTPGAQKSLKFPDIPGVTDKNTNDEPELYTRKIPKRIRLRPEEPLKPASPSSSHRTPPVSTRSPFNISEEIDVDKIPIVRLTIDDIRPTPERRPKKEYKVDKSGGDLETSKPLIGSNNDSEDEDPSKVLEQFVASSSQNRNKKE